MEFSNTPSNQTYLIVGLGLLLASITALVFNKRQRDVVLGRLHFQRRRASGAATPPRSLSPEKQGPTAASVKDAALSNLGADLINSFPPSRREVLHELAKTASASNKKILIGPEPEKEFLRDNSLPTTRSYDLNNDSPKYTPTGFSTTEIKAMGDFPAYNLLSGVPLPQPYEGFDHTKALPRPYRPLRWAYHQTMGKHHQL